MIYLSQEKTPQAQAALQDATRIAEKFAAQDPANVQWQRLLLACRLKMGHARGQPDLAVLRERAEILGAMEPLAEAASRADPDRARWQSDLGVVRLHLGLTHVALAEKDPAGKEHLTQALGYFTASRKTLKQAVHQAPSHVGSAQSLWEVLQAIGKYHEGQRQVVPAQEAYLEAWESLLAASERFRAAFPGNPKWPLQCAQCLRHLAFHHCKLAELGQSPLENLARAEQELSEAVAVYEALSPRGMNQPEWCADLAGVYRMVASAYQARGLGAKAGGLLATADALTSQVSQKRP
jgi:hypothetical protein